MKFASFQNWISSFVFYSILNSMRHYFIYEWGFIVSIILISRITIDSNKSNEIVTWKGKELCHAWIVKKDFPPPSFAFSLNLHLYTLKVKNKINKFRMKLNINWYLHLFNRLSRYILLNLSSNSYTHAQAGSQNIYA
jgi:hypothetical protein